MVKIRIIDVTGKDEVHTVIKTTVVNGVVWFYTEGFQYSIPANDILFMQIWSE